MLNKVCDIVDFIGFFFALKRNFNGQISLVCDILYSVFYSIVIPVVVNHLHNFWYLIVELSIFRSYKNLSINLSFPFTS